MTAPLETPELPAVGIVADLQPDDRLLLSSYGEFHSYQPGQEVIKQGDPQDCLFLVLGGLLHARRTANGREFLLGRIEPGESFGEINIFDPSSASATVVAREFAQVWRINREDLEEFLETSPVAGGNLVVGIATQLSRRLRHVNERLVETQTALLSISGWESARPETPGDAAGSTA